MKILNQIIKPNVLMNFDYLAMAFVLIVVLSACNESAARAPHENQFVNRSDDQKTLMRFFQTFRNPQATHKQKVTVYRSFENTRLKLRLAPRPNEGLSESGVRTILRTPAYIDLSEMNFASFDLSGIGFFHVHLSGTILSNANLSSSDFYFTDLSRADLSGANLAGANLENADLSEANLSSANLTDANMYNADLTGANLSGANLIGSRSLNDTRLNAACGNDKTMLPIGFSIPTCDIAD